MLVQRQPIWKNKGNLLIMEEGTKKDMQKNLLMAMPCQADIKYVFTSTGELYSGSPANCGPVGDLTRATYKISGNALTVTPKKGFGTNFLTTYTVTFKGDQLILSHEYMKAEKSTLHSRAKEILITYQRIWVIRQQYVPHEISYRYPIDTPSIFSFAYVSKIYRLHFII